MSFEEKEMVSLKLKRFLAAQTQSVNHSNIGNSCCRG